MRSSEVSRLVLLCAVALAGWPATAHAQTASSAKVPVAPSEKRNEICQRSLMGLRLADAQADRVGEHHRPTPFLELPGEAAAEEIQAAVKPPETSVLKQGGSGLQIVNVPVSDVRNRNLTSYVGEPTVAARGNEVLYTGNWYAAFSTDGGETFECISPSDTFDESPRGQDFCCDQIAAYDRDSDLMIWLLQYSRSAFENVHRLAVSHGADIGVRWRYYDLVPSKLGGDDREWFDYPGIAIGADHLYLTTNAFETTGAQDFTRSLIMRIPLEQLQSYAELDVDYFSPEDAGTLRAAQGIDTTGYWGTHASRGGERFIRVYSWPDDTKEIDSFDVKVDSWESGASAPDVDNRRDWLGRSDPRITASWMSGMQLGFAWTAAQDGEYLFPQVRVAIIDTETESLLAQPHIWNDDFAFAYPAVGPNGDGGIGITLAYGGTAINPSHAVGILTNGENSDGSVWRIAEVTEGADFPRENKWGDYLSIAPHGEDRRSWVATGLVLRDGDTRDDIQPNYTRFERAEDDEPLAFATSTDAPLTWQQQAQLADDLARLEAVWLQQPDSRAGLLRGIEQLRADLETLFGADSDLEPQPLDAREARIMETHRPAPADVGESAVAGQEDAASQAEAAAAAQSTIDQLAGAVTDDAQDQARVGQLLEELRSKLSPLSSGVAR